MLIGKKTMSLIAIRTISSLMLDVLEHYRIWRSSTTDAASSTICVCR